MNNDLVKIGVDIDLSRGFVVGGINSGGTAAAAIAGISWTIDAGIENFRGIIALETPITGLFLGLPMLPTEAMGLARYKDDYKFMDWKARDQLRRVAMLRDFAYRLGNAVYSP